MSVKNEWGLVIVYSSLTPLKHTYIQAGGDKQVNRKKLLQANASFPRLETPLSILTQGCHLVYLNLFASVQMH